jgi:hypothetical protein
MSFIAVDVLNDPAGLERLLALGTRKVPLLTRDGRYVFAENLENVAKFVGLDSTGHQPLAPEALLHKWMNVLRAAQRYVRQMPDERLQDRAIPNRDRAIRLVCHHVFRIGEAFVETMTQETEYWEWHAQQEPAAGTMHTSEDIARYGEDVIARLEQWWDTLEDRSGQQPVRTYMGVQPMHHLFERSAWHSAQHARQLMALLERYDIAPDAPLTAADLSGLPLPERLWE